MTSNATVNGPTDHSANLVISTLEPKVGAGRKTGRYRWMTVTTFRLALRILVRFHFSAFKHVYFDVHLSSTGFIPAHKANGIRGTCK